MGKSKELFMETHTADIDEYFHWLSEQEWLQYLEHEKERIYEVFGYTLTAKIKWNEFLNKIK